MLSDIGIFIQMMDAIYLKVHCTASKLHAVANLNEQPLSFFMTAEQTRDYPGAAAVLDRLPIAQ